MTRLFHVELKGYGTSDIESLGSYIHRLAYHHGVTVNALLDDAYKLYQYDYPDSDIPLPKYASCGGLAILVRPNELTFKTLEILAHATGQKNLRSSTFMSLYETLDRSVGGYYIKARWCPSCMHEFERNGDDGYYKLIWSLSDITHCHTHRVKLIDACPHCGARQDRYGYKDKCIKCIKCGESLGYSAKCSEIIPSWEVMGQDLLELVEMISKDTKLLFPADTTRQLIKNLCSAVSVYNKDGPIWNVLPRDECIQLTNGNSTATLTVARRFAARLGIKLTDILSGNLENLPSVLDHDWFKELPKDMRPRTGRKAHDKDKKYEMLTTIITQHSGANAIPLTQVAQKLSVSTGYIQYHFPRLANEVCERFRIWKEAEKHRKRSLAKEAIAKYISSGKYELTNGSKKAALRHIREETGLPKHMLRRQINRIFDLNLPSINR